MYHDFLLLYRRFVHVLVLITVFSRTPLTVIELLSSFLDQVCNGQALRSDVQFVGASLGASVQERYRLTSAVNNFGASFCFLTLTSLLRRTKNASRSGCAFAVRDHGDAPANATLHQNPQDSARPGVRNNLLLSILGRFRTKRVTRVELDWLDIGSPTDYPAHGSNTQASYDAKEEDILALRMMQIGGRWWPNEQLFDRHRNADVAYGHHFPPNLDVGCPSCSEGLLILRTWAGNSQYLEGLPGVAPERPDEWSRITLCVNMEERCEVLREFGAVFYNSVKECLDIPESLEEGVAQGKEYERLLKLMEDRDYVDRWLYSL
jgi:hypothetical protein